MRGTCSCGAEVFHWKVGTGARVTVDREPSDEGTIANFGGLAVHREALYPSADFHRVHKCEDVAA